MKVYLLLSMILIVISCTPKIDNGKPKPRIGDESFTIPFIIENDLKYYDYSLNYYSRILRPSWSCDLVYKDAFDTNDLSFNNDYYEINFPRYYYDSLLTHFKPVFYLIGYKTMPVKKGFVIIYLNKVMNIEKFKKYSSQKIELSNQINETTDTIYSSLPLNQIKYLYPKFRGAYKYIKIDSIRIDRQFLPFDFQFYESITLFDFELGLR